MLTSAQLGYVWLPLFILCNQVSKGSYINTGVLMNNWQAGMYIMLYLLEYVSWNEDSDRALLVISDETCWYV